VHNKNSAFLQMHMSGNTFVMANAWNAGSAVLLQEAGFKAIGTTSAGIAYEHALPDYASELPFSTALRQTSEIAAAVEIPVSMDSENCYGHTPEEVHSNMVQIAGTSVAGASIEDYSGSVATGMYDLELAVERVRAAKLADSGSTNSLVLTARSECYLRRHPDPFAESVKRINRYREAGADCLYVPGIRDIDTIKQLVSEVDGPVNVVMGLAGEPISVAQLQDAGVTRISIGGSLARATLGLIRRAAREILDEGTFGFSRQQIPDAELMRLFGGK